MVEQPSSTLITRSRTFTPKKPARVEKAGNTMTKTSEYSGGTERSWEREISFSIPDPSQLLKNAVSQTWEKRGRWLPKVVCLAIATLIISGSWNSIKDLLQEDELIEMLRDMGMFGPIILSVIQLLQVVIAVIPGDIFIVVAGKVYGFLGGFSINILSTLVASLVAFTVARSAGREVIDRLVPAKVLDRWMDVVEKRGTIFFIISFLVPIFPADVMNFVAGLSEISHKKFLVVCILGRAPKIMIATLLGSSAIVLSPTVWLTIGCLVACGAVAYLIWRGMNSQSRFARI
jgi:uncharacterized membrane protein YdjX (TVP38/TMEM64 family)